MPRFCMTHGMGLFVAALALCAAPLFAAEQAANESAEAAALFRRENLVAWCIVPFDAQKRSPEARAEMLKRLGFSRYAYDWRGEHLPTFDRELAALRKHGITLQGVWFPAALNVEARTLLEGLKRHEIRTELWITMGDPAPDSPAQADKVAAAARQLQPIVDAAAAQGCKVGLYNHGGWFGQPENQIAIIKALKGDNVGLVYNLHHGHEHLDRFAELLATMRPHLYALNLNGMDDRGDPQGRKILPLGQGARDLELLEIIAASGYRGPIGILGHTQDDAEDRLRDNLDGLDWLVAQLEGKEPGVPPTPRTPVPLRSDEAALVADVLRGARERGNAERGAALFSSARLACVSCHKVGERGGRVGPELTSAGKTLNAEEIVASIVWPRRQIKPEYTSWMAITADGLSLQGYKVRESDEELVLLDTATQQPVTIPREDIEELRKVGTLMPDGIWQALTRSEQYDLVRLLLDLGNVPGLETKVREVPPHGHDVATFEYKRDPLYPEERPTWQHHVNRHRVYDFYTKEANFFRTVASRPSLLPAFPGLEGAEHGHWGTQDEETWRDGRWNETDLGSVLCGVVRAPGITIPKGVCVRLGEEGELSACFNPETLCYEVVWSGGFLKFSSVRHGFMDALHPDGTLLPRPEGKKPDKPFRYLGFYRLGKRVVFAYRIDGVDYLDAPWAEDGKLVRVVAPAAEHPLKEQLAKAPPQWPQEFVVKGKLGTGRPYAVDTIPLPVDNPWKALIFPGDHAFLSDGTCLVCTMQGDVWQARGIDEGLERVTWRRIASGLHQALGMVIHDDKIYVAGRDQITQLIDLNDDGEIDYYHCLSNAMITSPAGHDYTCGLERDSAGRFYTASGKQGLIRIASDDNWETSHVEVLATGFRNPDGIGLAPDGAVTVPCSEGEWTPASMICLIKPDQKQTPYFGYGGPREGKAPALPMVYLPRGLDNSSGGQVTVPDDRWGPLAGQMIHLSYGAGTHLLLLRDEVDGQAQGAVVPLAGEFRSGAHRGAFNPRDGQLYVSGMGGWGTYTPDDGSLERVRWTGEAVQRPRAFHVHENGVLVRFTQPVDPQIASDVGRQFAQAWNYRYSQGYGSPEFSTRHLGVVGHDAMDIAGVHVVEKDALFVELPDLQPVNVLHLSLLVDQGRPQDLFVTVHKLDKPYTAIPGYRAQAKTIAAHPQLVDLARLEKAKPNPWQKKLEGARRLTVEAGQNLTFKPRTLTAEPGEPLEVVFTNPDVVPHNWVLIQPNTLAAIGDRANKLIAEPDAVLRHYVPQGEEVLVYTDIVAPNGSFSVSFRAPDKPGRYPFLCTFPGHWMVMNGELVVKESAAGN